MNGIIGILLPGSDRVARKAFDLKVTNSFALIALAANSYLLHPPSALISLSRYQHLTIPPDLHVHATASGDAPDRLTISGSIVKPDGSVAEGCHRVVTYVSAPADACRPLTGRWQGAALVSPWADRSYTSDMTRLAVDLFVHQRPEEIGKIMSVGYPVPGCRPAVDNSGSCFGPHLFQQASHNGRVEPQFWFTLRMGYLDSALASGSPLVVPASH